MWAQPWDHRSKQNGEEAAHHSVTGDNQCHLKLIVHLWGKTEDGLVAFVVMWVEKAWQERTEACALSSVQ